MKYILYGLGKDSSIVARNLLKQGCEIVYFVDEYRYNCNIEINLENEKKLFKVYYVSKIFEDSNKYKIVIGNVKQHEKIASTLRTMGLSEGIDFIGGIGYLQGEWGENGVLSEWYKLRIKMMSDMISEESDSIFDIGCGKEKQLKKYISSDKKYYCCDIEDGDNEIIKCDINKNKLPEIEADTIFVSGVLEYIIDYEKFIDCLCSQAQKEIIISFYSLEYFSDLYERKRIGFVNHFTVEKIISLFVKRGYIIVKSEISPVLPNIIFKFNKL